MSTPRLLGGIAAWVFGLATTIFLIAVWGRAVVIDVDAMQEAAAPLASSAAVVDVFTDWLDTELVEAGVDPITSELVIEDVLEKSSVGLALENLVAELVLAAAVPGPDAATVDVAGLLQPAVPEISQAIESAGLDVPESRIADVVAGLDPLVVRSASTEPYIGAGSPGASRLGIAAVLSLVVMTLSGVVAVAASEHRLTAARGLLTRVALGALSFSIILKLASWILDPDGGRAPLAESAAIVADSKWMVPFTFAVVTGAAAASIWFVRRRAASPPPDEPPKLPAELQQLRSG